MHIGLTQIARWQSEPAGERRTGLALCLLIGLASCSAAFGQTLVPFPIPAGIASESGIWSEDFHPTPVNSKRLRAEEHFYRDQRVRIWGVNLSFGANFPTHEDAPVVAGRLAAAGVNSVRCHHMDTARWPRGIWNAQDGRSIEPAALDRLDYFINELARRGIWVNINLHVGRAHSEYLELPQPNSSYDKIVGIFTPALIQAQKQYAQELLNHVNPYRKVRYADDPAVAFVEITNEDSFFMWNGDESLRGLPPFYEQLLSDRFNRWLQRRYLADDALRAAWSEGTEPLGQELLRNGNFETSSARVPEQWNLEQHSGCQATIARQAKGIQIRVDKADGTEWHLQLTQSGLPLKQGRYYTLSFDASSDQPRTLSCGVSQAHDPWTNLGLSRRVELTKRTTRFTLGFVARADDEDARISFALAGNDGPVNLAHVEFRSGGQVVLAEEESLSEASIALFQENESKPRIRDRLIFLAETEKAYFDEMRRYIKHDLGCGALVTGTIIFGPLGLYAQSDMDFIDAHAYWQHPRFPGRPWDPGNWIVEQKPMTDYPEEATLFRIAAERLAGKPFTVSEYNHPAPMDAQAECVPMMASFAAAQDWDGVWFYSYSHNGDTWDRQNLSGFFDIDTNPAKWGFMRAGAALFRDATLPPAGPLHPVFIADRRNDLAALARLHMEHDRDMLTILTQAGRITRADMVKGVYVPSFQQGKALTAAPGKRYTTLAWSVDSEHKGLYHATSGDAQVCTGHASRFAEASKGNIRITSPEFVVLTITPLEVGKKLLVTACGRCENTDMQFLSDRRTVGRNWGEAPVRIEPVAGQMVLPDGVWTCHALAPDGSTTRSVPTDGNVLKLSPDYETMWYLLERSAR